MTPPSPTTHHNTSSIFHCYPHPTPIHYATLAFRLTFILGYVHTVPIVKPSVAESVPDRASVHTRNAAFEVVSAPEQCCSSPLLKVERSVSDRFLKRSESSLNSFIGAEIATGPRLGKLSFQIKIERRKLHNGQGFCSHWERFGTISAPQQNINSCSHCTGATFETEQKPVRYSVNIA